jgi:hypothetical protein
LSPSAAISESNVCIFQPAGVASLTNWLAQSVLGEGQRLAKAMHLQKLAGRAVRAVPEPDVKRVDRPLNIDRILRGAALAQRVAHGFEVRRLKLAAW